MKRFPLLLLLVSTVSFGATTQLRLETQTQGILPSVNGGTGINNGGRTLTLSTNSGTIAFPSASTTQTFPTTSQTIAGLTETQTFTNKRITKRELSLAAPTPAPTINTDNYDAVHITALAGNITSVTATGTPVSGDTLLVDITDNGTPRTISWGANFESSPGETLPASTVANTRLDIIFKWNPATSKWRCVGSSDVSNAGASDIAYGPTWDGVTTIAGSKNSIYDYLHLSDTDDNGKINVLDLSTAGVVTTTSGGVVGSVAPGTTNNVLTSNGTTWVSSPSGGGSIVRSVAASWQDLAGGVLAAPQAAKLVRTVPYSGTITGWSVSADAGTATVKWWKKANGTAIPTISDNINTSTGFAVSSGTHLRSNNFTGANAISTTTVTAGDMFVGYLSAVTGSPTAIAAELEITSP